MGEPEFLDLSDLNDADRAEVIDLVVRLRARRAGARQDIEQEAEARAWLDTDASGLEELEPYDWGPGGEPAGTPVRWDAARGEFVMREAK